MPDMDLLVRPARSADRADGLLYESARPYYDAYAGGERRARALLAAVWDRPGHAASVEVCSVAEVGGRVIGVLAAFPAADADRLARRFLSLTLRRMPPWRWPAVVRHLRAGARLAPRPPARSLYVDALAVAPGARHRGVARALLAHAERAAVDAGLGGVALDTGLDNAPARALYERAGFAAENVREAPGPAAARPLGGRGFIAYNRPVRPSTDASASDTRATWPSVMAGKNGRASDRAATSSHTGNSPGRWPKRSR
jgi:ribosomal protein S18 acetylase RimI-like enzyme